MATKVRELEGRSVSTGHAPDVLIQDPASGTSFLVPGAELQKRLANAETWGKMGAGTVTFAIPNPDLFEEIPPFIQVPDGRPSVLIQDSAREAAYFLTWDDLQTFVVDHALTERGVGYDVSFVIPRGTELIEELPPMATHMLQSGEARLQPRIKA